VAKPKDSPYRSGSRSGWVRVKTSEWRVSNSIAGSYSKLFEEFDVGLW
jgi:hypothetical protein